MDDALPDVQNIAEIYPLLGCKRAQQSVYDVIMDRRETGDIPKRVIDAYAFLDTIRSLAVNDLCGFCVLLVEKFGTDSKTCQVATQELNGWLYVKESEVIAALRGL